MITIEQLRRLRVKEALTSGIPSMLKLLPLAIKAILHEKQISKRGE